MRKPFLSLVVFVALSLAAPAQHGATQVVTNETVSGVRENITPKRDAARISKVPKRILTDQELSAFLLKTHAAVEKRIDARIKAQALQIFRAAKAEYPSGAAVASAANGSWIIGAPEMALWLMGKACIEDPNADNLNNYAAFLTMAGAEEAALPILMKLDRQYPGNSTLLNNIGQAWFGLGDLKQAEENLDGAVRILGFHSQANYTKCLIEESKGNKDGAIDALKKSIREAYSPGKDSKLGKLGGFLENDDIDWNFRMPQDPLGLHRFIVPRYSKTVDEADVDGPEWIKFQKDCWALSEKIGAEMKEMEPEVRENKEFKAELLAAARKGIAAHPPFFVKAQKKFALAMRDIDGHDRHIKKENDAKISNARQEVTKMKKRLADQLSRIDNKYADRFGEGRDNPEEEQCAEKNEARNKYLAAANTLLEQAQSDMLKTEMRRINEETYYRQYMMGDLSFEYEKLRAKKRFLSLLLGLRHEVQPSCNVNGEEEPRRGKLPDFDDIHCDRHITLNMFFVKGEFTCNKSKLEYHAVIVSGKHIENLNTGEIIGGSVEIGVSAGIGRGVEIGPMKAEARAGVGVFVEYDESGVADMGPRAELKGELGANLGHGQDPTEIKTGDGKMVAVGHIPSVVAGVEARWGWNAGGSISGKGLLRGIEIK